eukprot:5372830-Amphidinium_carterae.1
MQIELLDVEACSNPAANYREEKALKGIFFITVWSFCGLASCGCVPQNLLTLDRYVLNKRL